LHVFMNERQGQFRERPLPAGLQIVKAIAVADANNDGVLDLLAVQADGAIIRISDKNEGESWDMAEIATVPDADRNLAGDVRLHVADLDNNGALDLFLAPTKQPSGVARVLIWLGDDKGNFVLLDHPAGPALVFDAADLKGDGRSFGRTRYKPSATSASTRSGSAAKLKFAPGCWCRSNRSPARNFILDWENRPRRTSCRQSGRTALSAPNLA